MPTFRHALVNRACRITLLNKSQLADFRDLYRNAQPVTSLHAFWLYPKKYVARSGTCLIGASCNISFFAGEGHVSGSTSRKQNEMGNHSILNICQNANNCGCSLFKVYNAGVRKSDKKVTLAFMLIIPLWFKQYQDQKVLDKIEMVMLSLRIGRVVVAFMRMYDPIPWFIFTHTQRRQSHITWLRAFITSTW